MSLKCERKGCPETRGLFRPALQFLLVPADPKRRRFSQSWPMEYNLPTCSKCTHGVTLDDFWDDDPRKGTLKLAEIVLRDRGFRPLTKRDCQLVWLPVGNSQFDKDKKK